METKTILRIAQEVTDQAYNNFKLAKTMIYELVHLQGFEMVSLKEESMDVPNAYGVFNTGLEYCPVAIGKIALVRAQGDSLDPKITYLMFTNDDPQMEDKLRDLLLKQTRFEKEEAEEIYNEYKQYFFELEWNTLFPCDTAMQILRSLGKVMVNQ